MAYIDTDYIPMSADNANWLYGRRVLDKKGRITKDSVRLFFPEKLKEGGTRDVEKDSCGWAVLCELVDKAREQVGAHPDYREILVDTNDMLDLLRTGHLDVPYTREGENYVASFILSPDSSNRLGEWSAAIT